MGFDWGALSVRVHMSTSSTQLHKTWTHMSANNLRHNRFALYDAFMVRFQHASHNNKPHDTTSTSVFLC